MLIVWNFFATSHGKSPCDGIGGTVKRLTTKASLQSPIDHQILNASDMYKFCNDNIIKGMFLYCIWGLCDVHRENPHLGYIYLNKDIIA